MTDNVLIYEVGPRDGLQNEARFIATPDKIALVDLLSEAGLRKIEVTSFVSLKWVPQTTDATAVMAGIRRLPDVTYAALTPNLRGAAAALQAQAGEIAIFASASESFSQKNINCSIEESLERFAPVAALAQNSGTPLRGYVSCITDCPYGGSVDPVMVAMVAGKLLAMGCYQVSLGDTLGRATPARVGQMLDAVMATADVSQLAGHFHDTSGSALANISVCLDRGIRTFDAAVGGLGGCPYAPGAQGNVATEAVVDLMDAEGFETGIDRRRLLAAAQWAQALRAN